MLNPLPSIVNNIFQDNNDDDKHASQLLKSCILYSIHKVALSYKEIKSLEKALDRAVKSSAAAIKAAAKKENHKQYDLIQKEKQSQSQAIKSTE